MNWLCRRPPPAFLMHLPLERGGGSFHCDLRDAISREVCFTGCYEPQETALVQALLRRGMTFVDVGANWGYFTLLAAQLVGARGRVISLEPDPRLLAILEANVIRNVLPQVTVLPVAAADKPGSLRLAGYEERRGNFGTSRVLSGDHHGAGTFTAAAQTLDALFNELKVGVIDLLKMDIEGAEGLAIAGLGNSLRLGRVQRLLLELHPKQLAEHGQSAGEVIGKLRDFGYRAWSIDHSPRLSRRVAYGVPIEAETLLRPFDQQGRLDGWPHLLWTRPGLEPLP